YFLLFLFHNLLSLFLGFLFYDLYQLVHQPFHITSHFLILLFLYQFHLLYILFSQFLLFGFLFLFYFCLLFLLLFFYLFLIFFIFFITFFVKYFISIFFVFIKS